MRIQPFHRIHPLPNRASTVSSPPYDVVTTAEARALAENRLESFLHVIRPEIDLPVGPPCHHAAAYDQAPENLQSTLTPDDHPTWQSPEHQGQRIIPLPDLERLAWLIWVRPVVVMCYL